MRHPDADQRRVRRARIGEGLGSARVAGEGGAGDDGAGSRRDGRATRGVEAGREVLRRCMRVVELARGQQGLDQQELRVAGRGLGAVGEVPAHRGAGGVDRLGQEPGVEEHLGPVLLQRGQHPLGRSHGRVELLGPA